MKDDEFNFGMSNFGHLWAGHTGWKFSREVGLGDVTGNHPLVGGIFEIHQEEGVG